MKGTKLTDNLTSFKNQHIDLMLVFLVIIYWTVVITSHKTRQVWLVSGNQLNEHVVHGYFESSSKINMNFFVGCVSSSYTELPIFLCLLTTPCHSLGIKNVLLICRKEETLIDEIQMKKRNFLTRTGNYLGMQEQRYPTLPKLFHCLWWKRRNSTNKKRNYDNTMMFSAWQDLCIHRITKNIHTAAIKCWYS